MLALLWTFPLLVLASIVIGWAAEVTAARLSTGIALALLAWMQTAPEFAVEAGIAWQRQPHLALANLTGSLRLLLGFGWPVIFLIHWVSSRRKGGLATDRLAIALPESFAIEALALAPPVLYFLFICARGSWGLADGFVLCLFYGFYFWLLDRQRRRAKGEADRLECAGEEEPWAVRRILALPRSGQSLAVLGLFVAGGLALWLIVPPFLRSLEAGAAALGVSSFVFIQWISPVASEFPEKVTAFGWARKPGKAPMALANMLASAASQWTLLAGLVPVVFSLSAGRPYVIELADAQRWEILLTMAQSALAVALLADLRLTALEAGGLFALWLAQLVAPSARPFLIPLYCVWIAAEAARIAARPSRFLAWRSIRALFSPSP